MGLNEPSCGTISTAFSKILPRSGVSRTISNAMRNEAVCLTAPYGCGKTLAVLSWLREHDRQPCWVSLEEKDNTESEFMAKLLAATHQVDSNDETNYQGEPGIAIPKLAENEHEKILVIDNFQLVSNTSLQRNVKDFIAAHLGKWRIIIVSRAELPTSFNDLILRGHIRLITPHELNFSLQETTDYFIMNGYSVSEHDVAQVHSETEGWPAALNAILAASHDGSISYGETARGYIMTFFETEVWNGLREDIKNFLIKTSVLEKLTPSACYAVTGIGASMPMLKWLLASGLFISKLEEENKYRYHHVFRSFLLKKLSESEIDESDLYMKVAWWHFERGEIAESFPYFFKASNYYGINQVLKILNPAEIGIEKYLEMASCITSLNIDKLKSYSILVLRIALIHFLMGNVEEMQRLSAIFFQWFESEELLISSEEYGEYVFEAGWLSYIDPAVSVLQNINHEAWSNYHEYVANIRPTHFQRHAVLSLPSALSGLRDNCCVVDTVDAFIKHNEETNRSILRQDYALYQTELISAEYAYETENFAKAEKIVRKIMTLAESKLHIDLYFICTSLLVKIMRVKNNNKEINAIINRLEAVIVNNKHHFLLPNFHAFELRNRLSCGHQGFTEIFLKENEAFKDKMYFYLIYRQITYVRGLLSLENYSEAMLLLGNLELSCNKYNRIMDLIEVNILKAIASFGLEYEDQACFHLHEALKEAEKYGFIRVFSDDAVNIWNILELLRKQVNSRYIQSIIISCKKALSGAGHKRSKKKYAHIELTKTELKILKSLQADMSYMEIALDNNISISTVKSHVHSIYSKLEVSNKTSAIIAAIKLGIIK